MATDFLAAAVLCDRQIVTYRVLSRELNCHGSESKKLLEEFHNSNKGTSHAVYLVVGTKDPIVISSLSSVDDDDCMSVDDATGQEEIRLSGERIPVSVVKIVSEEQLEPFKNTLTSVQTVEVYSIGPGPIQDLELISEPNRQVWENDQKVTDFSILHKYGVIPNPWVKRRPLGTAPIEEKLPPPPPSAPATPTSFFGSQQQKPASKQITSQAKARPKNGLSITNKDVKPKPDIKSIFQQSADPAVPTKQTIAPKDRVQGSILNAFSQAQAVVDEKKAKEKMAIPSDGEDDGEAEADLNSLTVKRKTLVEVTPEPLKRPQRADSPDIMDMDDDDGPGSNHNETLEEDVDMDDVIELLNEAKSEETEASKDETPAEKEHIVRVDGRRRGKRRVTKKVRAKDEHGFLVTREDQVWESFSESDHEVAPKKTQSRPAPTTSQRGGRKKGDTTGKKEQGSILSFFQKK